MRGAREQVAVRGALSQTSAPLFSGPPHDPAKRRIGFAFTTLALLHIGSKLDLDLNLNVEERRHESNRACDGGGACRVVLGQGGHG